LVKQQIGFKDPGSSGKALNWDFSSVKPINEEYSLNYFIPDSTDMFRLCGMEHNTRYYFRLQHDILKTGGRCLSSLNNEGDQRLTKTITTLL